MNAMRTALAGMVLLGLLIALTVLERPAAAQPYPPPVGSLTSLSSATTPRAATDTTLSAVVLDSSGKPVAGAPVVFQIGSQPGSDAKFSNGLSHITATTDAAGKAVVVLSVGSSPGTITVKTTSGEKTAQLTLQVQAAAAGTPTEEQPPSEGGGIAVWQVAIIAAGIAILLGGGVIAAARRRRRA